MSKRKSVSVKQISSGTDLMASNVFSIKDMQSQHQALNGEFLLYQVILKRLLSEGFIDPLEKIKLCEYFNPEDEIDRRTMKEFDETYTPKKAIYWYTRESCIYRMLNKAFRTRNIAHLIGFTHFIRDLYDQLAYEQVSFFVESKSRTMTVYRGQLISKDEVNRIRYGKGQLISMNSFMSTSTNRKKAIEFATSRPPPSESLTTILLEITLNLENWSRPYADIKRLSAFSDEEEILLMFGSIFRIDDILEDKELKLWRAQLTLCSDEDGDMTDFEKVLEKELHGKDMLVCLGHYMVQMQNFDDAEKHYEMLLSNELINNSFDLASCYHGLAQVKEKKGEYDDVIENLNIALEYLFKNPKTKTHPLVARCYNDLGRIYSYQENQLLAYQCYENALKLANNDQSMTYSGLSKLHIIMGNYQIALEFQQKALEKLAESDTSRIANTLMELGNIYTLMKDYQRALQTFEKTLRYQERTLFADHPDLGYTYIAMGLMFSEFKHEKKAFECINKALKLQLQSLPHDHSDFRETYKAFALLYKNRADYNQSLYYLNRLLENQLKKLSWKHPNVAETYSLIGNTHLIRKDYDQALVNFHKMLESQLERIPSGNPTLTKTLRTIADTYVQKKDFDQALTYLHRLLENELQRKLVEDPSLIDTYKSMANIYLEKKDFSQALIYFNRIVDIQLRIRPMDEEAIKETYTIIGDIYMKSCSIDQTLQYFSKLLADLSGTDKVLSKSFRKVEETHFEKRHLDQVTVYFSQLLEKQMQELSPGDPQLNISYQILGNIHLEKQNLSQAIHFFDRLLHNRLKQNTAEETLTDIYQILADMYFKVGNFDQSLVYFHKLLNNQLKETSPDRSALVNIYQMIAMNYLELCQFTQALFYLNQLLDLNFDEKKTLNIFGKVLLKNDLFPAKERRSTLPASFQLVTLTNNNESEQRHFNVVLNYFDGFLSNTSESSIDEDFSRSDTSEILAKIFLEKNDYDQSLTYFHQLLNHQLQVNSSDNPSLPITYKILTMIYYMKSCFGEALIYIQELLNYHLESKLSEDPFLADIYHMIAMIHWQKHRTSQALTYFYRSLDCHMQEKPIDPHSLAHIYILIATIFLKNQDWKKIFRKLLDNSSSTDSSNHSFQLNEDIHFEKRHLNQSLTYFHKLLDNQLAELKFGDALISETYQILAHIYVKDHRFDQAIFYFNKLLVNEFHRKPIHEFTLHYAYQMIGYLYFLNENYQRALLYLFRSIDCQLKKYSMEHPSILDTYQIIGKVFLEKHLFYRPKEALEQAETISSKPIITEKFLLDIYRRLRNVSFENQIIGQSLVFFHRLVDKQSHDPHQLILANIYFHKSDYDKALFYLTQSFEYQTKKNPFGDTFLADTYVLMANVYFQKKDYQQALKDYRQALTIYNKIYSPTDPKIRKLKQYVNEIYLPKHLE